MSIRREEKDSGRSAFRLPELTPNCAQKKWNVEQCNLSLAYRPVRQVLFFKPNRDFTQDLYILVQNAIALSLEAPTTSAMKTYRIYEMMTSMLSNVYGCFQSQPSES